MSKQTQWTIYSGRGQLKPARGVTIGADQGHALFVGCDRFARLVPAIKGRRQGDHGDAHADQFIIARRATDRRPDMFVRRGAILVGGYTDIEEKHDVGEDRRHADDHGDEVEHLHACSGRETPGTAQDGHQ